MKRIILALLMMAGLLVTFQTFAASPASAATCSDTRTKSGTTKNGSSFPGTDSWWVTTTVQFRTCIRDDGQAVARVYNIWVKNVVDACGFFNEGLKVNPNVIGDWNPGYKDSHWPADNCPDQITFYWGAPGEWVTVFASAPANERCLGGTWTAYRDGYDDDTDPLESVCII